MTVDYSHVVSTHL